MSENRGTFIKVFDGLVERVGPIPAIVYGVIFAYEQMPSKRCTASQESIAKRAGISPRSAFTAIHVLIKEGLILDETPGKRNAPHVFRTIAFHREKNNYEFLENDFGLDGSQNLQTDDKPIEVSGLQDLRTDSQDLQNKVSNNCEVGAAKV
ncbi:MAG TPA: helix-turn-helix domain-containing protein, partial [Anaerolinea sp.]|nr:helix-turn-helix domain-containing protein [Anaerolinea sp.]